MDYNGGNGRTARFMGRRSSKQRISDARLEKRDIVAVQFGPLDPPTKGFVRIPTIYIVATQHAREWGGTGTAIGLMRELIRTIDDSAYRPELYDALRRVAVVVVPVANPDGYEYTRTTDRGWRGNRNLSDCFAGVDLNRNHYATWRIPASSADYWCIPYQGNPETFNGPTAQSELETIALDNLLSGTGFWQLNYGRNGVVALDLHTYTDFVLYPSAYKINTDRNGPSCNMGSVNGPDEYCHLADFEALRYVFGDTEQHLTGTPIFFDDAYRVPFRRDHAANMLYTSSGTLEDEALYGSDSMFSSTIELFSTGVNFGIECEPGAEQLMAASTARILDAVEHLATIAPDVEPDESTPLATHWLTNRIGKIASAYVAREYASDTPYPKSELARPRFLLPVWKPFANLNPPFSATVNNAQVTFARRRDGSYYQLQTATAKELTGDPLVLPCEIYGSLGTPNETTSSHTVSPECASSGDQIKLCDASRLSATNWKLKDSTRGGEHDCWWEATGPNSLLMYPSAKIPFIYSRCLFSVSMENPGAQVTLERELPTGGFEVVLQKPEGAPFVGFRSNELKTYVFEANAFLNQGRTPQFRFRTSSASTARVYDPVLYCRLGFLE